MLNMKVDGWHSSPRLRPRPSDGYPSPKRFKLDPDEESTTAVLVYNVSLNDMLLATGKLPAPNKRKEFPNGLPGLARPLFSAQLPMSTKILEILPEDPTLVTWQEAKAPGSSSSEADEVHLPLGFELPDEGEEILSVDQLRFRKYPDAALDNGPDADSDTAPMFSYHVKAVFFPLLSAVVTAWLRGVAAKADRRVVVLASGRAEPRDQLADTQGNSTERTAHLMTKFMMKAFGGDQHRVQTRPLHADGDAFRYDTNLRFCHQLLLPLLDQEREEVALRSGDKWPERFSVTLALCDGTHSRMQVLSQCLREFRPEMAHLSPVKAFWHSCALRPSDVDRASYERAFEAAPPTEVAAVTDPALSAVIAEVIAHRNGFLFAQPREAARQNGGGCGGCGGGCGGGFGLPPAGAPAPPLADDSDLERFWLRKTRKPVLSVLLVQRDGGPLRMHRGINLEVSMPTGSLCAERNVIGTAFACDPSLRREDLRAIAVLAVGDPPSKGRNPLAPCGACMEWLKKIYEVNPSFKVLMFEDELCRNVFVKTVGRLA
eukprot:TRINITY_DN14932_c0_g3_i1.p1 TRINITY_DN14932_c0_g3~~TRINITY_DN14932_c0_g3_i1.p1  ORF type:complete len:544 (-),score=79.66 TRINITY_DN14932_c0_g3_i1:302-1933(-)